MIKLILTFMLLSTSVAAAQSVVGTSFVNGRKIQILDDFSWRYASTSQSKSDCRTIDADLEFCGDKVIWTIGKNASPDIVATFAKSDREQLFFIVEQIGSDDGATLEAFTQVVIENAANGAGITTAELPIYSSQIREVLGREANTLVYKLEASGLEFVMINTHFVWEKKSGQIVTWRLTKEISEADLALHEEALAGVRLKKE